MRSSGTINTSIFNKLWLQDDEVTQEVLNKAIENGLEFFTPEQVKEQIEALNKIEKSEGDNQYEVAKENLLKLQKKTIVDTGATIYVRFKEANNEPIQKEIPLEKAETKDAETIEEIEQFFEEFKSKE